MLSDEVEYNVSGMNEIWQKVGGSYLCEVWTGTPFFDFIEGIAGFEEAVNFFADEDEDVLQAMEPGEEMSRLCCSRKKDGTLSGDLATREQLRLLERYVFDILGDMVDKIASGDVTPNPYTRGTSHDACAFCPYGAVCHKATVAGRRNYKAMAADRFWEEVEKEVQRRG